MKLELLNSRKAGRAANRFRFPGGRLFISAEGCSVLLSSISTEGKSASMQRLKGGAIVLDDNSTAQSLLEQLPAVCFINFARLEKTAHFPVNLSDESELAGCTHEKGVRSVISLEEIFFSALTGGACDSGVIPIGWGKSGPEYLMAMVSGLSAALELILEYRVNVRPGSNGF